MKLLIASDIHGDALCTQKMLDAAEAHGVDKIIILGDILYHGPRNDLPENYSPKKVVELLNAKAESLLCVRGNCDAEVDGMVLSFPVDCDNAWIFDCEHKINIYLSHGHKYNPENLPPLPEGSIFLYGHTHLFGAKRVGNVLCINPGSVSLPKGGNPKTYTLYSAGEFKTLTFDGKMLDFVKA